MLYLGGSTYRSGKREKGSIADKKLFRFFAYCKGDKELLLCLRKNVCCYKVREYCCVDRRKGDRAIIEWIAGRLKYVTN